MENGAAGGPAGRPAPLVEAEVLHGLAPSCVAWCAASNLLAVAGSKTLTLTRDPQSDAGVGPSAMGYVSVIDPSDHDVCCTLELPLSGAWILGVLTCGRKEVGLGSTPTAHQGEGLFQAVPQPFSGLPETNGAQMGRAKTPDPMSSLCALLRPRELHLLPGP